MQYGILIISKELRKPKAEKQQNVREYDAYKQYQEIGDILYCYPDTET